MNMLPKSGLILTLMALVLSLSVNAQGYLDNDGMMVIAVLIILVAMAAALLKRFGGSRTPERTTEREQDNAEEAQEEAEEQNEASERLNTIIQDREREVERIRTSERTENTIREMEQLFESHEIRDVLTQILTSLEQVKTLIERIGNDNEQLNITNILEVINNIIGGGLANIDQLQNIVRDISVKIERLEQLEQEILTMLRNNQDIDQQLAAYINLLRSLKIIITNHSNVSADLVAIIVRLEAIIQEQGQTVDQAENIRQAYQTLTNSAEHFNRVIGRAYKKLAGSKPEKEAFRKVLHIEKALYKVFRDFNANDLEDKKPLLQELIGYVGSKLQNLALKESELFIERKRKDVLRTEERLIDDNSAFLKLRGGAKDVKEAKRKIDRSKSFSDADIIRILGRHLSDLTLRSILGRIRGFDSTFVEIEASIDSLNTLLN
jgi:hypothetical protein